MCGFTNFLSWFLTLVLYLEERFISYKKLLGVPASGLKPWVRIITTWFLSNNSMVRTLSHSWFWHFLIFSEHMAFLNPDFQWLWFSPAVVIFKPRVYRFQEIQEIPMMGTEGKSHEPGEISLSDENSMLCVVFLHTTMRFSARSTPVVPWHQRVLDSGNVHPTSWDRWDIKSSDSGLLPKKPVQHRGCTWAFVLSVGPKINRDNTCLRTPGF